MIGAPLARLPKISTQAEVEVGVLTEPRIFTPERIAQAIRSLAVDTALFPVFIPLAGVIDSAVPVMGQFADQATGQTGNYAVGFAFVSHHLFILVNSITTGGDIVVSGTSVNEATGVPIPADTETITVDTATGQYYQTTKKWLEVTNIDVDSGSIVDINYDLGPLGYYDSANVDFSLAVYRADIRASGNNPDLRIRMRKIQNDGGKKFSFVTIEDIGFDSTASNGDIVDHIRTGDDDRSYSFGVELLDSDQQLVFKMNDFNTFFTNNENRFIGGNNEGILIDLLGEGDAGISSVDSLLLTLLFAP